MSKERRFRTQFVPSDPSEAFEVQKKLFGLTQGIERFTIPERMKDSEKQRIFSPAIAQMHIIGNKYAIPIPDNLLDRLHIVFEDDLRDEIRKYIPIPRQGSDAQVLTLPNRHALISVELIEELAREGISKDSAYRWIGVHELWHSLDHRELWRPINPRKVPNITTMNFLRRAGLATGRTFEIDSSLGTQALMEGFTEYRTRQTVVPVDGLQARQPISYQGALESVDMLMKNVGEEIFYTASHSQIGYLNLVRTIDHSLGKGFFRELIDYMAEDHASMLFAIFTQNEEAKKFLKTKEFIHSARHTL